MHSNVFMLFVPFNNNVVNDNSNINSSDIYNMSFENIHAFSFTPNMTTTKNLFVEVLFRSSS